MPIVQSGSLNTTALVVPDLYVQVVPPQNLVLNGVPTNVVGMLGTASWGPVNQPVTVGSMSDYARAFGPLRARKYDMGTQVATAVQQGAQAFRCVRVSDGTDQAASYALFFAAGAYAVLLAARYTGALGNQIGLQIVAGSAAGTWRLTIGLPGQLAESFDNLAAPTAAAFWRNLVNAVNLGQGPLRGPSQLCVASLGSATNTAPAGLIPQALQGGTDGADTMGAAGLIGSDGLPRRGMYALRGQGCSLMVLADVDDPTTWTTQAGFAQQEGLYAILAGPSGDGIPAAIAAKQTAGLDTYSAKLMFGDWVYWSDPVAGTVRLVSPQGFVAGRLSNLSPGAEQPEQAALRRGRDAAGRGAGGWRDDGVQHGGADAAAWGRDRRDCQPAAGRGFLGGPGRAQLELERRDERGQLHAADELHCGDAVGGDGAVCGPGDQCRAVPADQEHAAEFPAGDVGAGDPGERGWEPAVQRDLRPEQQSGPRGRVSGMCSRTRRCSTRRSTSGSS